MHPRTFDAFDSGVVKDPWGFVAALRREALVYWQPIDSVSQRDAFVRTKAQFRTGFVEPRVRPGAQLEANAVRQNQHGARPQHLPVGQLQAACGRTRRPGLLESPQLDRADL